MEPTTQISNAKTRIDPDAVLRFLQSNFDSAIESVAPLTGGEHSQAFSFLSKGNPLVVRVDKADKSFRKDSFAFDHFASSHLRIPKIHKIIQMSHDLFICISEKAEGIHLSKVSKDVAALLMPRVLSLFEALEEIEVPRGETFGPFDENGIARFPSWKEALLSIEHSTDYPWDEWFRSTCLEREIYQCLFKYLSTNVDQLPELRRLVHGDIGMDNILTDGKEITAVLDWGQARYGDPVFDVAWLDLWWEQQPFASLYREHATRKDGRLSDFEIRLRWYSCWIGLTSLSFFAKTNQLSSYQWLKDRMKEKALL